MTPFAFDTLSASKRLREAGMAEGVAEAVVSVFQHATASVDFGELATKVDLTALRGEIATLRGEMATKSDILDMATKADLTALRGEMATKSDIADMARKADLDEIRRAMATKADLERFATREDLFALSAKLADKMMTHTLALGGLVVTLFGGVVAIMVLKP